MNYATLTQCKRLLGLSDSVTADDALLSRLIADADRLISAYRNCKPQYATRLFDYVNALNLTFDDDLLEITTLTNGDATTISSNDYVFVPRRVYPKWGLEIKIGSDVSFNYSTSPESAISIAGTWGYHDDYTNAWVSSRDAVADVGGINASVTTITVSDADGTSADLETPRFQAGNLIKIDSEWCDVIAVTAGTTNTLTVVRGVNGTTAASHSAGASISLYRPPITVIEAAMQYVKWRYDQRINRGSAGFNVEIPADITALLPAPLGAY